MSKEVCDPEVFKYGAQAAILDCSKEDAEKYCTLQTKLTGRKHDWSFVAGRVVVRAIPRDIQELLDEVKRLRERQATAGAYDQKLLDENAKLKRQLQGHPMPENLHDAWYFDISTMTCYKVRIIPQIESKMLKIHDIDRDPTSFYFVHPSKVCQSKNAAICAAEDDLNETQLENHRQRDLLQQQDDELERLLNTCKGIS